MAALLAMAPIVMLLVCMVGLGWSAAWAGMAGAALAMALAIGFFGYGTDPATLAGPLLESGFTAATILWIVFPALVLHEMQTRSGASGRIGNWLAATSHTPMVLVLILAWFFALLLEGAAGFGTPVALVAPMLVALGYSARRALILALVGHAIGVSFGAVGTPMIPLLAAFPGKPQELSLAIMLLHAALGWTLALVLIRIATVGQAKRHLSLGVIAACLFLLPALALAWLTGPELPTLGGALIGGALFVAWTRWSGANNRQSGVTASGILSAALPYLLVLAVIVGSRTIPALTTALQSYRLHWSFDGNFSGMVQPLYHPGTMLMIALAGTMILRAESRSVIVPVAGAAARRLPLVALALVSVLLLARVMVHSGMIDLLANTAAAGLGRGWPVAVPLIGALGSFITGSATTSNILFAEFQVTAAEVSGLSLMLALAGQGFGAAIGNIIAPHNIVAGAATVGLLGREGAILKTTLPICLAYAAMGGLLLLALAAVW